MKKLFCPVCIRFYFQLFDELSEFYLNKCIMGLKYKADSYK